MDKLFRMGFRGIKDNNTHKASRMDTTQAKERYRVLPRCSRSHNHNICPRQAVGATADRIRRRNE